MRRRLAWVLCGAALVLLVAWVPLALSAGETRGAVLITLLVLPALPIVAGIVAAHRPANPVGWLLLVVAVAQPAGMVATQALAVGAAAGWDRTTLQWLGWVSGQTWVLSLPLLPLILLLFPDGCPRTDRWRWPVRLATAVPVLLLCLGGLAPGEMSGIETPLPLDSAGRSRSTSS